MNCKGYKTHATADPRASGLTCVFNYHGGRNELAFTTADGRATKRDVAAATLLTAASQAVAIRLQHLAAPLVATGAGDATPILGHFATNGAKTEVHLATGNAVKRTAARTEPVGRHLAKVLQRCTSNFIITAAVQLESASTFLKPHFTARHHQKGIASRSPHWGCTTGQSELRSSNTCRSTPFHQHRVRHS